MRLCKIYLLKAMCPILPRYISELVNVLTPVFPGYLLELEELCFSI
jgi:hypothetical protein